MIKLFYNILFFLILFVMPSIIVHSQVLLNNGGYIDARAGSYIYVDGSMHNSDGEMTVDENAGINAELYVTNDITNDAAMTGNGHIRLLGDWYNNSTFNAGTGNVFFEGDNQLLGGITSTSFYNLTLDGSGLKTQQIDQYCTGILDLKHLELQTETHVFFMENTASGAIIRTTGFVSSLNGGHLTRNTNLSDAYLFPVGSSVGVTRYRPVELTPENTTANTYTVRMANLDASIEGYNITNLDPAVSDVNSLFYHQIDRTSGTSAVNMNVFYDESTDGTWEGIANWSSANTLWEAILSSYVINASPLDYAEEIAWDDFTDEPYILCKISINPTFNDLGPYCVGDTPDVLPNTSLNGILGTWSPSVISTASAGTTAYTFTPDGGQQAAQYIMDVTVNPLPDVTISTLENISCHGMADGRVVIVASGGADPYDYFWSNNVTLPVITNVVAGDYQVTVTDDNGCETVTSVSITEPDPLVLTESITPIICGHAPGACGVTASGGNGGYTYDWQEHSGTGANITGLSQGMYTVVVTDSEGCNSQASMFVTTNGQLNVLINEDQAITCFGESNAILSVTAPGGMNPLAYQWNIGSTSDRIENLSSGIYSVVVTDDWGCSGSQSHQVTEPLPINLDFETENIRCYGEDNGQAVVIVSGGTGPYSSYWPGYGVGDTLNQLSAGYYTVIVSDVHNCEVSDSVLITEPETALSIDLLSRNITCYGANDGQIAASGVNGTSPYSYEWSFDEYTSEMPEISNLHEGFYSLFVSDNNGCITDTMVVISEPAPIIVDYSTVNPSCFGNNDGSIDLAVVGGVEPYTFMWDNASLNVPFIDGLYEGNYFITIQDANDCTLELQSITLMDTPEECLRIPDAFTPNGDDNNDTWIIENLEMFPNAIVQVFNRWGQVVYEGKYGSEPWDGKTLKGKFVPTAPYIYVIKLHNGIKPYSGIVTVIY